MKVVENQMVSHTYVVSDNIVIDDIANESVISFNDDNKIILLNDSATWIVNLVKNSDINSQFTYEEIADLLIDHFEFQSTDLDKKEICNDIKECFETMKKHSLIYEKNDVKE